MPFKNKQKYIDLKNGIGADQFKQDYPMLTEDELVDKYQISHGSVRLLKRQYNLSKPRPHKRNSTIAADNLRNTINKVPSEQLRYYYIDQNHSWNDTCLHFGITHAQLAKLVKYYKLNKPVEKHMDLVKQTKELRYNNPNFNNSEKTKQTCLSRYGATNWGQRNIRNYAIWENKQAFEDFLKSFDAKPTVNELADFFNVDRTNIFLKINEWGLRDYCTLEFNRSHCEDEILQFLKELGIDGIKTNVRGILDYNQEIDIYLPDYNMGIEFNGNYWHSDVMDSFKDHNGRSRYHQNKSLNALRHNIFLFHIFEYEWRNPTKQTQIKERLKTILGKDKQRIPARKCSIVELDKDQKKRFLNDNHIQGNDHCTKAIGLVYNGELVSCMTFVPPKSGKYTWELTRFCNKKDTIVQGGASKLFKHFVATLNPGDTIVSFNDITKTKGDLYRILNFTQKSINAPNYIWMNFMTGDIRTRYQEQAGGEVERMHSQGYHRICDCGTITWVYRVL